MCLSFQAEKSPNMHWTKVNLYYPSYVAAILVSQSQSSSVLAQASCSTKIHKGQLYFITKLVDQSKLSNVFQQPGQGQMYSSNPYDIYQYYSNVIYGLILYIRFASLTAIEGIPLCNASQQISCMLNIECK